MRKQFFIFILLISTTLSGFAQLHAKKKSSVDLGIFLGGSYYIGDLNQTKQFLFTKPAGGVLFRYNVNPRLAFRGNVLFGSIEGHDSYSSDLAQKQRNLSFKSNINEVSIQLEFNFLNYRIGVEKEKFSPYLFFGTGFFKFNPMGQLPNGNWVALQPLHTEGEGMEDGSKNKPYKLVQISLPFGIGFKTNIARKMGLSVEWGMRKTFTDYLDDVSGRYYPWWKLDGPTAAYLSDPSKGTDPVYGNVGRQRGNKTNKDWYSFVGIILSFQMKGKVEKCPTPY